MRPVSTPREVSEIGPQPEETGPGEDRSGSGPAGLCENALRVGTTFCPIADAARSDRQGLMDIQFPKGSSIWSKSTSIAGVLLSTIRRQFSSPSALNL